MKAPLIVGNWKMNGGSAANVALARTIASELGKRPPSAQVAVAPPFTALAAVKEALGQAPISLAAQNCHWQDSGAYTGEISPAMLAEIGCEFVIVGHSERRHLFAESDERIAQKLTAVMRHGMRPILCIGETLEERQLDRTKEVIDRQINCALKGVTEDVIEIVEVAYEPVWAIGTGLNASVEQIHEVHERVLERLQALYGEARSQQLRILYGGSVKPENAEMIAGIAVVSGLLVGGASLTAQSFLNIARAFSR